MPTFPDNLAPLLTPLSIGQRRAKNRIFISAHAYGFLGPSGLPSDKLYYYVRERLRGGVALMVLGETQISDYPNGPAERWASYLCCDEVIPIYRRLSQEADRCGALIFEQLSHPGGQVWPSYGCVAVAPSAVPHSIAGLVPRELSEPEIGTLVEQFGDAARRVRRGGLHGVEIKCDQGKLHHQFLSRKYNRRCDRHGGSVENRLLFLFLTLKAVRSAGGADLVIGLRLPGDTFYCATDKFPDLDAAEIRIIVNIVESWNLVDYISVSGGTNSFQFGYWQSHGDSTVPPMNFVPLSAAIKAGTKLPIFVGSNVRTLEDAALVVRRGHADMVAMTRAHIAEPAIIAKALAGHIEDIRPCIACNQSCVGNTWEGRELRCIHNPAAGRELECSESVLSPAKEPRQIVVIGGGPAGMEFARVSALRGHFVTLCEETSRLGGRVNVAAITPHRERFAEVVTFLERQLLKAKNCRPVLNCRVNANHPVLETADVVVLATGAHYLVPPEFQNREVQTLALPDAIAAPQFWRGERVLIVDEDWHLNALSYAELISSHGAEVWLVTSQDYCGKGLDLVTLTSFHSRLRREQVTMRVWTEIANLERSSVQLRSLLDGEIEVVSGVSAVVFACPPIPDSVIPLATSSVAKVYKIGDCAFSRGLEFAIYDAHSLALRI